MSPNVQMSKLRLHSRAFCSGANLQQALKSQTVKNLVIILGWVDPNMRFLSAVGKEALVEVCTIKHARHIVLLTDECACFRF